MVSRFRYIASEWNGQGKKGGLGWQVARLLVGGRGCEKNCTGTGMCIEVTRLRFLPISHPRGHSLVVPSPPSLSSHSPFHHANMQAQACRPHRTVPSPPSGGRDQPGQGCLLSPPNRRDLRNIRGICGEDVILQAQTVPV